MFGSLKWTRNNIINTFTLPKPLNYFIFFLIIVSAQNICSYLSILHI